MVKKCNQNLLFSYGVRLQAVPQISDHQKTRLTKKFSKPCTLYRFLYIELMGISQNSHILTQDKAT